MSRYFISSVTTYSTSGKSRKGALLQAVASGFQSVMLTDTEALDTFIGKLRDLVAACNKVYGGRPVVLTRHTDVIEAHLQNDAQGPSVFNIHFSTVGAEMATTEVESTIFAAVFNVDRKVSASYMYGKGGDR